MQFKPFSRFLLCVLCASGVNPTSQAADKPAAAKLNYQDHVMPILRDKCLSCHDADKARGGLDMTSFGKLMEGGGSGVVVKPGDPDGSRLFLLAAHKAEPAMPPMAEKLPQASLDTIQKWIAQGALENAGSKAVAMKPKTDVGLSSVVRGRPAVMPMPAVSLSREPVVVTPRADAVTALAASPWAPLVAIGGQKQVLLYNTDSLGLIGVFPFPYGRPNVIKFSRNGSMLLAGGGRGGHSGKVVVWSVARGEKIIEVGDETDTVLAADISVDQTQIALGGPKKMVRIYSTKDGEKIREIKKHTDWITSLEYSPDGVLLSSADRNGGLFVWEAHTGREFFSLRGHTAAITEVAWRDDSNVLASSSEDATIRLWEMENGTQVRSWNAHAGGTQSVRFSHDGKVISTGRDRHAKLWEQSGAAKQVFEPFPDVTLRAAFTHDSARVIASDWSGKVRVFLADGKPVGDVSPNPSPPAQQFEAAMKELEAKQTAYEKAKAAAEAAQADAAKANAEHAAAQKAVADMAEVIKKEEAALSKAKELADKTKSAIPAAQARVPAKEVTLAALAEALAKVKAAAEKAKDNAALAAELENCQKLVNQATADLATAKKGAAEAAEAAKATQAKLDEMQKKLTDQRARSAEAVKLVPARAAAMKSANEKAAAANAELAKASQAVLSAAKSALDRFKALPRETR